MSGLDFFKQETAKKTIVKEERKEVDAVKPLNYLGETETSKDFFRDVAANIKSRENTPALGVENLAQRNVEGRPRVHSVEMDNAQEAMKAFNAQAKHERAHSVEMDTAKEANKAFSAQNKHERTHSVVMDTAKEANKAFEARQKYDRNRTAIGDSTDAREASKAGDAQSRRKQGISSLKGDSDLDEGIKAGEWQRRKRMNRAHTVAFRDAQAAAKKITEAGAQEYARLHGLIPLFEGMTAKLLIDRPEDPLQKMLDYLRAERAKRRSEI